MTLVLEKYYHLLGMNCTIILQQNSEQCKAINVSGMGNMLNDLEWGGITVGGRGAEVEPGETSAKPDTGVQPVCSGCSYRMLNNEMFLCQMVTVFHHTHSRVSSDRAISVPPPGIPNISPHHTLLPHHHHHLPRTQ